MLPDPRLRVKGVVFWRCWQGHTEEYYPFEYDLPGTPWRPCRICRRPMEIVRLRLNPKTGALREYAPRRKGIKLGLAEETKKPSRIYKSRTLLMRIIRRLGTRYEKAGRFCLDRPTGVMFVNVRLAGDTPYERDGIKYDRYLKLLTSEQPNGVQAHLFGVAGWLSDVKRATKRAGATLVRVRFFDSIPIQVPVITTQNRSKKR